LALRSTYFLRGKEGTSGERGEFGSTRSASLAGTSAFGIKGKNQKIPPGKKKGKVGVGSFGKVAREGGAASVKKGGEKVLDMGYPHERTKRTAIS